MPRVQRPIPPRSCPATVAGAETLTCEAPFSKHCETRRLRHERFRRRPSLARLQRGRRAPVWSQRFFSNAAQCEIKDAPSHLRIDFSQWTRGSCRGERSRHRASGNEPETHSDQWSVTSGRTRHARAVNSWRQRFEKSRARCLLNCRDRPRSCQGATAMPLAAQAPSDSPYRRRRVQAVAAASSCYPGYSAVSGGFS